MKHRQGFSILENLIAIVLISVMLTVIVSAYSSLIASKTRSRYIWGATQYARTEMEWVVNAFQQLNGWKFFSNHLKESGGQMDPDGCRRIHINAKPAAGYRFNRRTQPDPIILDGIYYKQLKFCTVYRDQTGSIVKPSLGQFDRNTAQITIRVWPVRPGLFEPIELVTYIANLTGKTHDGEEDDEDGEGEDEVDEESEAEEETL